MYAHNKPSRKIGVGDKVFVFVHLKEEVSSCWWWWSSGGQKAITSTESRPRGGPGVLVGSLSCFSKFSNSIPVEIPEVQVLDHVPIPLSFDSSVLKSTIDGP